MKYVCIDTHALVWYLMKPRKLGRAARRILRDVDDGKTSVIIPAAVVLELSLLREAGRKIVGLTEVEALVAARPEFSVSSLDFEQTREFSLLGSVDDPFDRMIIAAARTAKVPLVTGDTNVHDSALVDVIWD